MAFELLLWLVGAIVAMVVIALIVIFNDLIGSRLRVENAYSQIDVQLKRRFDLIPNLVEVAKAYMKHESKTFLRVTKARSEAMKAETLAAQAETSNNLSDAVKTFFAVAENYPQLRASENFMKLQDELQDTEEKIAFSRMFYNDSVQIYNTKIAVIPNNLVARMFNFQPKEYFRTTDEQRQAIKVKL